MNTKRNDEEQKTRISWTCNSRDDKYHAVINYAKKNLEKKK